MKLAVFSDPHIDIQIKRGFPDFLSELDRYLNSIRPDIIMVTGDVAGSTKSIQQFFEGINLDATKIFCPGNHDVWVNSKSHDASWVKYYQVLPELCEIFGWHYLPNNPLTIKNTAFVGTMGWYDYSSRNPAWDDEISLDEYKSKINKDTGSMWMDREFAKFGYDDKQVADHLAFELISDLNSISQNLLSDPINVRSQITDSLSKWKKKKKSNSIDFQSLDTIIIGTHIVPFLEFVRLTGKLDWDYFSAYIGNATLGEIIDGITDELRKISVFGHTHFPQRKMIKPNFEAICCPLGYPNEWKKHRSNLNDLFTKGIIEIDI
ncbi:MAG: metallophosphoesterase [Candidatus Kariarchaeaceae archaeon]|jgi:predicted phosphohydrolase